jgi:hypothetical protein
VWGNSCAGSALPPVLEFDESGTLVRSFGAGLFLQPHGLHVDHAGNVWVTDASDGTSASSGQGHQVFKFSPGGTLLLTLGKAGTPGDGTDRFNRPPTSRSPATAMCSCPMDMAATRTQAACDVNPAPSQADVQAAQAGASRSDRRLQPAARAPK